MRRKGMTKGFVASRAPYPSDLLANLEFIYNVGRRWIGDSGSGLGEFLSDLRSILGFSALRRVGRKMLDDDCLGLAGQLAYFVLLSLFPFLMSLVAIGGLAINDPESVLETMAERMRGFLPADAAELLVDYADRTLRGRPPAALFFAVLLTLGSGSAASQAVIKGANRAYEVRETRRFRTVWGYSVLMIFGFALLVGALTLVTFSPEMAGYVQRGIGLPEIFLAPWGIFRWVLAFLAVSLALAFLYYLAPAVSLPFKWITPGGLAATVLMLLFSVALNFYVANVGRYDQVYGQIGAVVVLMLWLYITGLTVLIGTEMNAVLARMAEERKGVELVQEEAPANETNA
jgi:membrane protein